jgi:riboflavin biosynthesis pyrimidine reductase
MGSMTASGPLGWLDEPLPDLEATAASTRRPHVTVQMIASLDGHVRVGGRGQTWAMGSETDHRLFRGLRQRVDAVLVGARTLADDDLPGMRTSADVRADRESRGLLPEPLWVVMSGSGSCDETLRFFRDGTDPRLLVTGPELVEDRRRSLEAVGEVATFDPSAEGLRRLLTWLRDTHGVRRIQAIGGPTLNASLLAADCVDELWLTVSPVWCGGSPDPALAAGPGGFDRRFRPVAVCQGGDEVFVRYRRSQE